MVGMGIRGVIWIHIATELEVWETILANSDLLYSLITKVILIMALALGGKSEFLADALFRIELLPSKT